jgi:hypothetical protein
LRYAINVGENLEDKQTPTSMLVMDIGLGLNSGKLGIIKGLTLYQIS